MCPVQPMQSADSTEIRLRGPAEAQCTALFSSHPQQPPLRSRSQTHSDRQGTQCHVQPLHDAAAGTCCKPSWVQVRCFCPECLGKVWFLEEWARLHAGLDVSGTASRDHTNAAVCSAVMVVVPGPMVRLKIALQMPSAFQVDDGPSLWHHQLWRGCVKAAAGLYST
jgi:hypothetical protein